MKAVVFGEHGGVEKLQVANVHDPTPAEDEVLIRVRACALNYLDLWARRGLPGVRIPLPHISGSDIAGVVEAKGSLVRGVETGEEVVVSPGLSCGRCEWCLSGEDNLCRQYRIIGFQVEGGYAELVKVPAVNVLPKPKHLTFEEAASVPLVFLTAWNMLDRRARVQPGGVVLVVGAGSGVGSAAVQIAKLKGAKVIATAGAGWKLERARALGADFVINHAESDIFEGVKRATDGNGVDVVVEHVGLAVWEKCLRSLKPGGTLVTCGATSGFKVETDLRYVYSRSLSIHGAYMGSKADLLKVLALVNEGKLKPVVDRVFNLEEAAEAQRRMEGREHFGKIVLKV